MRGEPTLAIGSLEPQIDQPPARPRSNRAGWAWAVAVVLGVVTGVGAWQWTESQQPASTPLAGAPPAATPTVDAARPEPAPTARAPQAEPGPVAAAPEVLTDPGRADPTAAGRATAPPAAQNSAQTPAPATGVTAADPQPPASPAPVDQPGPQVTGDGRVAAASPRSAPPVADETVRSAAGSGGTQTDAAQPPARATASRRTAAAAPAAPPTPRATCGNRTNFSLVYCMQQQCRRPAYSAHPQCREFRRTGEVD
jgi:hypothetical protein